MKHLTKGYYISPTSAKIVTYETKQVTRRVKDKEVVASELVPNEKVVSVTFDLAAVFAIHAEFANEGETDSTFLERATKEGWELEVPTKDGAIHPNYLTISKKK